MRRLIAAALVTGLGTATPARAEPVTLINVFEIPMGKLDEALRYWEAARDLLARQPGYVSTRLHQAMTPQARFQLINIAIWESPAAFEAAMSRMGSDLRMPPPEGLAFFPALYRVVRN